MLDQIELLVHGVRNVSNSIAHDLRTPLAELRSRLEELSLIRPSTDETYAEIDGAVADVDRSSVFSMRCLRFGGNRCRHAPVGLRVAGRVPIWLPMRWSSMNQPQSSGHRSYFSIEWTAAGIRRSGASSPGIEQFDRQRTQVRPATRLDRGGGAKTRRHRGNLGLRQWTGNR